MRSCLVSPATPADYAPRIFFARFGQPIPLAPHRRHFHPRPLRPPRLPLLLPLPLLFSTVCSLLSTVCSYAFRPTNRPSARSGHALLAQPFRSAPLRPRTLRPACSRPASRQLRSLAS